MASVAELNESFAIPGVLEFDEPHAGFIRARVSSPACTAELFLYGAHLAQWQPAGSDPVLFLSPRSSFEHGKPIRGGVPVIFPWFGPRSPEVTGGRTDGPSHGFARTTVWDLNFAGLVGDNIHLALSLGPGPETRAAGFDHFRIALEFTLGHTLTMRFAVANEGDEPLIFEQALHTYLHVSEVADIRIKGLQNTQFHDKTDGFKLKIQDAAVLTIDRETDRPYLNTEAPVTVEDPGLNRALVSTKTGSQTTVVWNPWQAVAERATDIGPDVWHGFVCVETANAAENRVTLAPRSAHLMESRISVQPLPSAE